MTDSPVSPYSTSSAAALFNTLSGSMEGPALKLYTLAIDNPHSHFKFVVR